MVRVNVAYTGAELATAANKFLADRTNGRAIGSVSSVVVCDVTYCG